MERSEEPASRCFFFDGSYLIPNPLVPADDGLSPAPHTGPDAGQITVNGELNKLAHNVSFRPLRPQRNLLAQRHRFVSPSR
jgi:hypothetical protein